MTTRANASSRQTTRWSSTTTMRCFARPFTGTRRRLAPQWHGPGLGTRGHICTCRPNPDYHRRRCLTRCKELPPWPPNGDVWRRSGTSTWTRQSVLQTVDYDNAPDITLRPGVSRWRALTTHSVVQEQCRAPCTWRRHPANSSMSASLQAYPSPVEYDVSGRTVVTPRDSAVNATCGCSTCPPSCAYPRSWSMTSRTATSRTSRSAAASSRGDARHRRRAGARRQQRARCRGNERQRLDRTMQRVEADITPSYGSRWLGGPGGALCRRRQLLLRPSATIDAMASTNA